MGVVAVLATIAVAVALKSLVLVVALSRARRRDCDDAGRVRDHVMDLAEVARLRRELDDEKWAITVSLFRRQSAWLAGVSRRLDEFERRVGPGGSACGFALPDDVEFGLSDPGSN